VMRLQAITEIITNQTTQGLELPARQQTQNKAATYQKQLMLDYLLAEERGAYIKF
ncbi:ENR1 protein, partial [Pachyramphus minor]|nr:ENR1 protein [Pachyramphus minor]